MRISAGLPRRGRERTHSTHRNTLTEKYRNMTRHVETYQAVCRLPFPLDVTVCPYCNLENISVVRMGEKPNKQINKIIEGQGHLARQDLLWIWVLVTNGVGPVIGSDTATK